MTVLFRGKVLKENKCIIYRTLIKIGIIEKRKEVEVEAMIRKFSIMRGLSKRDFLLNLEVLAKIKLIKTKS